MDDKRLNCPVCKKCGGCQLSNMSYSEQLSFKQAKVIKLLGKMHRVDEIIPSPNIFNYRNKVQAAFGTTRRGMIISGVYQSSTHNIVKIDSCGIEDKKADEIIVTIRKLLVSFGLSAYNEHTGKGFLRHVLVKRAFATGEIMVVLVTGSNVFKSKNAFCTELLRIHPDITTIIQNTNNKYTSLVLGEQETVLYGNGYITDILCGLKFRISSRSFYQINRDCAELMFDFAVKSAGLTGNETVVDAYSGVGTIGLIAASGVKRVISVELNSDAVRDAGVNAKINNIKNVDFYCADASDFMFDMAQANEKADLVIMDPPRAGSTVKFMKSVLKLSPQKILYISCCPETLARDLNFFVHNGYKINIMRPFDMFPFTAHVETVILLSHKNADNKITVKMEFGDSDGQVKTDEIKQRADKFKPEPKVTYKMIQQYIEEKYGFKVHTAYIAEVKRDLGLPMYDAPNAVDKLKNSRKHPTPEKVKAIKDALRHFKVISAC